MKLVRIVLFVMSLSFASQVTAQNVCITKTGEKYHKSDCRFLKYSKTEITLKKAKSLGYSACKVCKPQADNTKTDTNTASVFKSKSEESKIPAKKINSTRCTGKTKKGVRCKRMTKKTNGRCYQH